MDSRVYNVKLEGSVSSGFNGTPPFSSPPKLILKLKLFLSIFRTETRAPMKLVARRSEDRNRLTLGWLDGFQTFSLYNDDELSRWGALRHLNEDRVKAGTGFGTHPHREMEIFTYVVGGQVAHDDSMGNREILKRGDIQMTSTGTGIRHAEFAHDSEDAHFLQIWVVPWKGGLKPAYYTRHFTDEEKKDRWLRVVAPLNPEEGVTEERDATGPPAPIHAELTMYAAVVSVSTTLSHPLSASSTLGREGARKAYMHVPQTSGLNLGRANGAEVRVSGDEGKFVILREGDGAFIEGEAGQILKVENVGGREAEVVLLEV